MNWSPRFSSQTDGRRLGVDYGVPDVCTSRRESVGDVHGKGVVATAFPAATEAACQTLRNGGNAVDAAVAAAWALSVCEPANSGLGGQTIMLIRRSSGEMIVLDGHSCAPMGASLDTISRNQQRTGYRATTIPSTPLILDAARQCYGRLSLEQVIGPAFQLAEHGYAVSRLHRRQTDWCMKSLMASPSASQVLLRNGRPYGVGETFRQPKLAATLRRMVRHGVDDFYHGHIARQIAQDMRRGGGLLTLEDLAAIAPPIEQAPSSTTYRAYNVFTTPAPSGGWQVLLGLNLLQRMSVESDDVELGHWYQVLGEVVHTIFLQRERLASNAEVSREQVLQDLLSDGRVELLAVDLRKQLSDGQPTGGGGWQGDDREESGETTHLCTADNEGNVVSLTQSIQSLFGARVACEPCGFLYNNYLTTCPRVPHANQLGSRCQPRSNMAPTMLIRTGRDACVQLEYAATARTPLARFLGGYSAARASVSTVVLGAAGSRRITSAVLHTISGIVDRRISLLAAVNSPRLHVKLSRNAWLERSPETEALVPRLAARFRHVTLRSRYSYAMGCVQAVQVDGACQVMSGAADPRREGTVAVVKGVKTDD